MQKLVIEWPHQAGLTVHERTVRIPMPTDTGAVGIFLAQAGDLMQERNHLGGFAKGAQDLGRVHG